MCTKNVQASVTNTSAPPRRAMIRGFGRVKCIKRKSSQPIRVPSKILLPEQQSLLRENATHVHTHAKLVANLDAITHLCLSDRIRQMNTDDGAGRKESWYPQPETVF